MYLKKSIGISLIVIVSAFISCSTTKYSVRNYLSKAEKQQGYILLFDGKTLDNWTGDKRSYIVEDGNIALQHPNGLPILYPEEGSSANLFTKEEYSDFDFRFEFQLTPGANNGLGIRTPLEGNPAYLGMEIQILDDGAEIYKNLHAYQFNGSIYGVVPAKRGYLKPVSWNYEEVIAKGSNIKVILNGTLITDANINEAIEKGTMDGHHHPGLKRQSGHIGFLGHGSIVRFRNIRIKNLSK